MDRSRCPLRQPAARKYPGLASIGLAAVSVSPHLRYLELEQQMSRDERRKEVSIGFKTSMMVYIENIEEERR